MWVIYEHGSVARRLHRTPKDVLQRYEKWKDIVVASGPEGLKQIKGFRDKPLQGKWKGHRASRLNKQYRVIYRIEADVLFVLVMEVTPHDFRRK